jgi:hypothetical protein
MGYKMIDVPAMLEASRDVTTRKKGSYRMNTIPSKYPHIKPCTKCGNPRDAAGSGSYCKACHAAYVRERRRSGIYKDSPVKRRDQNYRSNYGITLKDYNRMLRKQGGVCFICGKPEVVHHHHGKLKPLGVDHNHETGQVRRLLCTSCNTLVYVMESDPKRIERSIAYLKMFQE